MSDKATPKFVDVELRAVRTGFYANALRDRGTVFHFTGDELPKWAVPVDAHVEPVKAKPLNGDLKPKDAQAAVRKKAASATGADLV